MVSHGYGWTYECLFCQRIPNQRNVWCLYKNSHRICSISHKLTKNFLKKKKRKNKNYIKIFFLFLFIKTFFILYFEKKKMYKLSKIHTSLLFFFFLKNLFFRIFLFFGKVLFWMINLPFLWGIQVVLDKRFELVRRTRRRLGSMFDGAYFT